RTLGLAYQGVVQIDKLAKDGEDTFHFPRAMMDDGSFDFSFSGLKSSFINTLNNLRQLGEDPNPNYMAASFQASVVD
ncbi:tRNA (adenosine(37)-N6)-threonylcarbamoyltransferase complex transferase subunit TsaD, partial [Listeria monocytogenes]|nr:tRNA (adenosine(37)-N6)-threonylcarbamoyltransferase complex transferase subunit TsaD [Listeria monocytogenes]